MIRKLEWILMAFLVALAASCNSDDFDQNTYRFIFRNQGPGTATINIDGVVKDYRLPPGQSKDFKVDKDSGYSIDPDWASGRSGVSPLSKENSTATFTITEYSISTYVE